MFKKELNYLVILALILAMFTACEKVTENDNDDAQEDPTDYTWDTSTVVLVTLNGNSISVVPSVATVSGSIVTIMSAGTYNITGSLSDGQIIVNSEGDGNVRLILNGTFTISGGSLIAGGPNSGNMIEVPGTFSSQYCVKATSTSGLSSSTLFQMEDESGNDIVTFKPVRSTYYVVVSSSAMKNGSTYEIYTGGTSTGTNTDGLYTPFRGKGANHLDSGNPSLVLRQSFIEPLFGGSVPWYIMRWMNVEFNSSVGQYFSNGGNCHPDTCNKCHG
jgi:hypothetical protein